MDDDTRFEVGVMYNKVFSVGFSEKKSFCLLLRDFWRDG